MTSPKRECNGAHCKCMNLDGECPNVHYGDCLLHNPYLKEEFDASRSSPEGLEKKEGWEREFENEYKDEPIEIWCVGFVAQVLTQNRFRKFGSDMSDLTACLKKKFLSTRREVVEEIERYWNEGIKNPQGRTYQNLFSDLLSHLKEL